MKNKILIVTPDVNRIGGVANHYLGLKKYWTKKVKYVYYGKRHNIPAVILLPFDILKYAFKILVWKPDAIIVNPSLRKYQLCRDGIYLLIGVLFKIDVISFFHGWDDDLIEKALKKSTLFKYVYNKSSLIFVLCSKFRDQLIEAGISKTIVLTTTKVDDDLLNNFSFGNKRAGVANILFLARIEENKGIFVALETFRKLQVEYRDISLTIVGDGGALGDAKSFVYNKGIKNVHFAGRLMGQRIAEKFIESDLYILPTTHGEGMPTSVLEAMAFGLPIITRPVGGLNDFFENDKMGYLIDDLNPESYCKAIKSIMKDNQKYMDIAHYNYNYAIKNFLASMVAKQIEDKIDLYDKS